MKEGKKERKKKRKREKEKERKKKKKQKGSERFFSLAKKQKTLAKFATIVSFDGMN